MINYELMVILSPELGEEKTQKELEELRKLIISEKGEILNEDIHGLREFAYRIKKHKEGFYCVFHFDIDPGKVKEFENVLNLDQSVLRYLLVKTPKNYEFGTMAEEALKNEAEKAKKVERERPPKPKDKKIKGVEEKVEKSEPEKTTKSLPKKEDEKPEEKTEPERGQTAKAETEDEKEAKERLDEVDRKLKSIIDDPDITL